MNPTYTITDPRGSEYGTYVAVFDLQYIYVAYHDVDGCERFGFRFGDEGHISTALENFKEWHSTVFGRQFEQPVYSYMQKFHTITDPRGSHAGFYEIEFTDRAIEVCKRDPDASLVWYIEFADENKYGVFQNWFKDRFDLNFIVPPDDN
jgi:hypothetical protein